MNSVIYEERYAQEMARREKNPKWNSVQVQPHGAPLTESSYYHILHS